MANHGKRSKKVAVSNRTPKYTDIKAARKRAGHTQEDMADVIYIPIGTLRNYEQDVRDMDPSTFEYYLLRTGQFRIEGVKIAHDDANMSVLELRTDDERLIEVNIRPAELARLLSSSLPKRPTVKRPR